MRLLIVSLVAGLMLAGFGFAPAVETPVRDTSPRDDASIKDVMQQVMKGGLLRKVMGGDASLEEKMQVLDLFISFSESEAPQGDQDEWHVAASTVMSSYAKFLVGREGAAEALKTATNCKACHDKFKPE